MGCSRTGADRCKNGADDEILKLAQRSEGHDWRRIQRVFYLETYEEDGTFLFARERADVIERERDLGGYFAIVTSEKMTAKEALELQKSRDASEKLFKGDKSYLGN